MRLRNYVIGGLCSAVIAAQGASTPGGNDPAVGDDGLDVVPEDNLKNMRGGVDLGNLVGYFAIDRVVQVDGQVVAKMQIVVSNLDKLSKGGMPTVSVSGPLSELVQVMNGPAGSGGGNAAAAAVAAAKTIADPQTSGTAGGVSGSSGSAGSTAAGSAAAQAGTVTVNVGSGTTVVPATGTATTVTSNAQGAAGSASANGAATGSGSSGQSSASSETISKVIPIGNTGQFVVVSNLPSSAGLATAIQNEVKGTLVQVQTTITAQLNGLTMLNSATLANALRSVGNLPTQTTGK
jgi:hypothetical protein